MGPTWPQRRRTTATPRRSASNSCSRARRPGAVCGSGSASWRHRWRSGTCHPTSGPSTTTDVGTATGASPCARSSWASRSDPTAPHVSRIALSRRHRRVMVIQLDRQRRQRPICCRHQRLSRPIGNQNMYFAPRHVDHPQERDTATRCWTARARTGTGSADDQPRVGAGSDRDARPVG